MKTRKKNKNKYYFWLGFGYTALIILCIAALTAGIFKSYGEMRRIGFRDENKKAVSFNADGTLRILDFDIDLKKQ